MVDQKTPYTLHASRKYVWVRWWYDVFKSQMHNFDGPPTTLQTEHRTRLQAWFNTYDVSFPTLRRRRWQGGGGSSHSCTQTLLGLAWDTSISIPLYSVRITLKVGRWMNQSDGTEMANPSTTGRWISSTFHQILPHVQSRRLHG